MSFLEGLSPAIVLPVLAALALASLGLVLALARKASLTAERANLDQDPSVTVVDLTDDPAGMRLRESFRHAMAVLRRMGFGGRRRYDLPWFLMLGGSGPENAAVLSSLGLSLPYGEPPAATDGTVQWWIYDRAVVIQAAGVADASSVDATGGTGAWLRLLRELREARPARPLDGLIVTLSAADLLEPVPSDGGGTSVLVGKASLLFLRIAQAEAQLGFRFPVQVLITDCEQIDGFNSFVVNLEPGQWREIFGWATPYPLTTPYASTWGAQALASVTACLYRWQLALFGRSEEPSNISSLFLFPQGLAALAEPLTAFLNHLFLPSSAAEPCFLRGVYFCGAPLQRSGAGADVLFVRDLFAQKIFPEGALARPTSAALARRGRVKTWAQALLVLTVVAAGLGLWLGPGLVSRKVEALLPWLRQVQAALPASGAPPPSQQTGGQVLAPMSQIDSYRVETWALPASWLSGVDGEVHDSVGIACAGIFLPAIQTGLTGRIAALDAGTWPPPNPTQPVVGLPEDTGEFRDLAGFTGAVLALEGQAGLFDDLVAAKAPASSRYSDFQSLAAIYLNVRLKPPTWEARRVVSRALDRSAPGAAAPVPLAPDPAVQGAGDQVSTRFYGKIFSRSYAKLATDTLTQSLVDLGQPVGPDQEMQRLQRLLDQMQLTTKTLARGDQQWVGAPVFAPGAAYKVVLAQMGRSAWLGPAYSRRTARNGDEGFTQMQAALAADSSDYTGPVLARQNGQIQLQLSAGVQTLEKAIQGLLGQPFVGGSGSWQKVIPPNQRLVWSVPLLTQAAQLEAPYQQFLSQGVQAFSPGLRQQVSAIATEQLSDQVATLLGQAQSFTPAGDRAAPVLEPRVQQQVPAFSAATPPLGEILTFSQQLGLAYGYPQLARLVEEQALQLLRDSQQLLDQSGLYVPRDGDFSWWDGRTPPSPRAFGATDANGLKSYLAAQRGRASQVAAYAAPVLSGAAIVQPFEPGYANRPAVVSWNAIQLSLTGYANKSADNTLAALESFISTDMTQITADNCQKRLAAEGPAAGNDFFQAAEASLQSELLRRCDALTVTDARAGYERVALLFNSSLAGRYPFAAADPPALGGEATPEAIHRFFDVFDQHQALIEDALSRQAPERTFGGSTEEVRRFMREMRTVRAFFASYLSVQDPTQPPAYDLNVTFRTNRDHEVNGNQVASWSLQLGSQEISATNPLQPQLSDASGSSSSSSSSSSSPPASGSGSPSATPVARWVYGNPVQVALGWAQNSPWQPSPGGQQPRAAASGNTVTWQYANAWSLISLLRDQAAPAAELDSYADPQPQTLRFLAATQSGAAQGSAKVFVRVQLQTTDQKKGVLLPPVFPTQAPRLIR